MSVSSHLNIRLDEYDARIRTFIPGYEQMLDAAAGALRALDRPAPVIVDLGIGTGALAARCADARNDVQIVGVDADPAILEIARRRLGARGAVSTLLQGSFLELAIPPCDAVVASLSLHHVHDPARKARLYAEARAAIREGGLLVSADAFLATDARLAALDHAAWRAHLAHAYSEAEIDGYFAAWAGEDTYLPLEREVEMLRAAGFATDVVWRVAPFAVVVARAR